MVAAVHSIDPWSSRTRAGVGNLRADRRDVAVDQLPPRERSDPPRHLAPVQCGREPGNAGFEPGRIEGAIPQDALHQPADLEGQLPEPAIPPHELAEVVARALGTGDHDD